MKRLSGPLPPSPAVTCARRSTTPFFRASAPEAELTVGMMSGFVTSRIPRSLPGCSERGILEVTNPDIITDVTSASGALALKNGVILRLEQVTAGLGGNGPDNLFIYGGLLADEWRSGDTFVQRNDMDQRRFDPTNTFLAGPFRSLNRVRVGGQSAINALRTYSPTPASNIGLMFALTAFVENLGGEYYCNGIPLSGVAPDGAIVYGDP